MREFWGQSFVQDWTAHSHSQYRILGKYFWTLNFVFWVRRSRIQISNCNYSYYSIYWSLFFYIENRTQSDGKFYFLFYLFYSIYSIYISVGCTTEQRWAKLAYNLLVFPVTAHKVVIACVIGSGGLRPSDE